MVLQVGSYRVAKYTDRGAQTDLLPNFTYILTLYK